MAAYARRRSAFWLDHKIPIIYVLNQAAVASVAQLFRWNTAGEQEECIYTRIR